MNAINYLGVNGNSPSLFNNTDPENRYYPNNEFSYKNNKINSFDKINVDNDSYLEDPTQPNVSKIYSNVAMVGSTLTSVNVSPLNPKGFNGSNIPPQRTDIKPYPRGVQDIVLEKDRKDFNYTNVSDIGKGFEYYPKYDNKFNFSQTFDKDKPYNGSFLPELKDTNIIEGTETMYQTEKQFNDNRDIGPVIPSMTIEQYNNCLPTFKEQTQTNIYLKPKIEGFKNIDNNWLIIIFFIIILIFFIKK